MKRACAWYQIPCVSLAAGAVTSRRVTPGRTKA